MELVLSNNPILTKPCEEFDFSDPPVDPIEFAHALVKLMRDSQGLGLAANQVGYSYRVFAMRSDPNKVFYNPKIVNLSEEMIALEEGCLSFPGLYVTIKRPRHARIRYTQPNGETLTEQFTGMSARIIQHEMDHLDGIIFYNRANRYHRELALDKWRKGNKQIKGGVDLKDVRMHDYEVWSNEQGKQPEQKLITSEIDLTERDEDDRDHGC